MQFNLPGWTIARAENFFQRLQGLMFKSGLPPRHGLFFSRCNAVHTCFMRFTIDVVFLDDLGHIHSIHPGLKPWRYAYDKRARDCLELPAGAAHELGLQPGQMLYDKTDAAALMLAAEQGLEQLRE